MNRMIELKNVYKTYYMGEVPTHALENIDLDIYEGEILVIVGPSGSGKTTMLNVISGLDNVTQGSIKYNGKNITKLSDRKKTRFRKDNLGFIFQTYNLLDHLNVYENVKVGSVLSKNKINIGEILVTVGLEKHKYKEIYQLSGGEQQRVSIARAIAKNPKIMFCDEPTGALDEKTGKVVLESLVNINEKFKTTTIIITHNPGIALIGDRIVKMNSGKIVKITKNKKRIKPKDIPWG
jgi:putative ABC transport system ATP-binding protein